MNRIACIECRGRVDRDEGGLFLWFPDEEHQPDHLTAYPIEPGEACCGVAIAAEEAA